jgi:hypothetical protein
MQLGKLKQKSSNTLADWSNLASDITFPEKLMLLGKNNVKGSISFNNIDTK